MFSISVRMPSASFTATFDGRRCSRYDSCFRTSDDDDDNDDDESASHFIDTEYLHVLST